MSAGGRSAFYTDKYGGEVEVRSCDCCCDSLRTSKSNRTSTGEEVSLASQTLFILQR